MVRLFKRIIPYLSLSFLLSSCVSERQDTDVQPNVTNVLGCGVLEEVTDSREETNCSPRKAAADITDVPFELGDVGLEGVISRVGPIQEYPGIGGPGGVAGDFDNDHLIDLIIQGRDSYTVFRNNGGNFSEVQRLETRGISTGGLTVDFNGDGFLDFFSIGENPRMYFGLGNARFNDTTAMLGFKRDIECVSWSATAGDTDGDGDIDIIEGCYLGNRDGTRGQRNLYWENLGGENVREVGVERGIVQRTESGRFPLDMTYALLLIDVNNDSYLDLVVRNDGGFGGYDGAYLNDGRGNFSRADIFGSPNIDDMCLSAGDWNGNGTQDFVSTNYYGYPVVALFDCNLQENNSVSCDYISSDVGLSDVRDRTGWGCSFGDFRNFGALDIVVSAGGFTSRGLINSPNLFYYNTGKGFRAYVPSPERSNDGLSILRESYGLLIGTFMNDGVLDWITINQGSSPTYYRNRIAQGNYIAAVVSSSSVDTMGIGTRVVITPDGKNSCSIEKHVLAGGSFAGNSFVPLHFGLGDAESANLKVFIPRDGSYASFKLRGSLEANHLYEINIDNLSVHALN